MDKEREILLLGCLYMAMREPEEMRKKWRTDVIGIAMQFGGAYKPKRAEFEAIMDKPLREIVTETK